MLRTGDRDVATPVVVGEQLNPPKYGDSWSEEASRIFFAAFLDYEERVKFANAEGVVRRQVMSVSQLIPIFIQRCFAQHFYGRREVTTEELLSALRDHAGYTTAAGNSVRERAAVEIRRVSKMQSGGGSVKDRVMHVSSALERYFCENPSVDALYRASNGDYLPGPAESVSRAMVDGISPPSFQNYVRHELTYMEGWKKQPNLVLRKMIDLAESWKIVEVHGSSGAGGSARSGGRQGQPPSKQQSSWKPKCYNCGEVGHMHFECRKSRAQGEAKNEARESSESRGSRDGGRGRGNRGRVKGRGGRQSAADGSTSAAASSSGPSGTSAGSTASSVSGRAVYVGGAGNLAGSAGAGSSQPSSQAGFSSEASTTVANTSAPSAYSASWSGWSADSQSMTPAAGAQPWRQVTLETRQGPSAGVVPVDQSAECLRADLSLAGSVGSFMARVFLDSGSALTSIGVGLLSQMSSHFGGAQLQIPFENGSQTARTATGNVVTVTHKTVPIEVSVRTPWGAVKLPPITFAVMPGSDNVVLFGMATMKELGIDLYPLALERLRPRAVPVQQGVESPSFLAARRVTVSIDSFQQEATEGAPADAAVERLVDRGPEMLYFGSSRECLSAGVAW
ncbi:unnamed protein product [Hapterophycus canaliculatus]